MASCFNSGSSLEVGDGFAVVVVAIVEGEVESVVVERIVAVIVKAV